LYNPEVGREDENKLKKRVGAKKKILVIGGGVAGMEAAYVAATRGHDVTLIEKEKQLGGLARAASVLEEKKEFAGAIEYLEGQLKRLKVKVRMNRPFSAEDVKQEQYDDVIVATGSTPIMPRTDLHTHAFSICSAIDALHKPEETGKNIVVIGGGSVGVETAEHLCRLGKNVTIVEMLDRICRDLGPLNRVVVLDRISRSPIKVVLNAKVLEINDDGIVISREGREEALKSFDTLVVALGARPNPVSPGGVDDSRVHYIADCKTVGNAMDAIHDAFNVAVEL
jgi:NADPH-dependent 2,4-dienoyl-CoA reductase/sulfur reductase-like enzyme